MQSKNESNDWHVGHVSRHAPPKGVQTGATEIAWRSIKRLARLCPPVKHRNTRILPSRLRAKGNKEREGEKKKDRTRRVEKKRERGGGGKS